MLRLAAARVRRLALDRQGKGRTGAIDGAVFGLLGCSLLHVFRRGARFDARRSLIVEEANCIGTAWLRLDLLRRPRNPLREKFRQYLDARLAFFRLIQSARPRQPSWPAPPCKARSGRSRRGLPRLGLLAATMLLCQR